MDDIDRIHLRATRIIHNLPCNIHNDDIMNAPYWNSINLFYIKRLLVITYIYYGNSVEALNNLKSLSFTKASSSISNKSLDFKYF